MKYIKLFENFIFDILENKKESRYSQEVLDSEGKIKDKIATLKDIMKITKKQSE